MVGLQSDRVERVLRLLVGSFGLPACGGLAVRIVAAPPAHQGLGSGTQLSLATAVAVHCLLGVPFDLWTVARKLGRGRRSAIGIAAFERGGFLIDSGRTASECRSDQVRRVTWPLEWRFVVVRLTPVVEISGEFEEAVFACPDSLAADARVPKEMARFLLEALPEAVAGGSFGRFAGALGTYGKLAGRCFARYQGGLYSHPVAARIALFSEGRWGLPVLQSSWGPTVAIPARSAEHAEEIRDQLVLEFRGDLEEVFVSDVARGGASVDILQAARL